VKTVIAERNKSPGVNDEAVRRWRRKKGPSVGTDVVGGRLVAAIDIGPWCSDTVDNKK
jgi:hypothetical protein